MKLLVLAVMAAVSIVPFSASAEMTPQQVEQIVKDVIARNPELIISSLEKASEQREASAAANAEQQIAGRQREFEQDNYNPMVGNPNGDVTITMFSDYRCGYCRKVLDTLDEIMRSDSGVKVISKDLPILGEISQKASRASIAFYQVNPERWWDFHKVMQRASVQSEDQIIDLAKKFDVSGSELRKAMASSEVDKALARNHELANIANISGTPGFVIGGKPIFGALPTSEFRKAIDAARRSRG